MEHGKMGAGNGYARSIGATGMGVVFNKRP